MARAIVPKVHNKYHNTAGPNAVYIGRGSIWGNPFVIGKDGDRNEVCDKFEQYLLSNKELKERAKQELKGKDLVCFCSPQRCHGDTLLHIANTGDELMSEQARGIVEVVNTNKAGYYGVKVGNDWYGAGKSHPGVDKGDYIEFEFSRNGRFMNLDPKTIRKPQANVSQSPSIGGAAGGAAVSREDYWANKAEKDERTQAAINWQAARNAAIAAVNSMVEHGVVSLPSAKAKKYDVFMALVDEVSTRYFHDTAYVLENMCPPEDHASPDMQEEEEGAPF